MKVYLVAASRFKQLWKMLGGGHQAQQDMKLYLAGTVESLNKDMKLFLAESGGMWEAYFSQKEFAHAYILQSFFYADEFTEQVIIPNAKDFMLDSGAFSFMSGKGNNINWKDYAKRYVEFINRNNVQKYIELDLDYIIGVKESRQLRDYLEAETNRQAIPVWHPIRGKEEFLRMCEEYSYVCLGGIVGKKWRGMEQLMPWFISEAHKRGAKIHGLGFTQLRLLPQFHFDSVDSTAWTTGNRFGYIYYFDEKAKTMKKIDAPKGYRIGDTKSAALHNYQEWLKFQKWADVNL